MLELKADGISSIVFNIIDGWWDSINADVCKKKLWFLIDTLLEEGHSYKPTLRLILIGLLICHH